MTLSGQFQACLFFFYENVLSLKEAPKRKTNDFLSLRNFYAHKKLLLLLFSVLVLFLRSKPFCKKTK